MSCVVCGNPCRGKRKTCSDACLREARTANSYRLAAAKATQPTTTERRCPSCGKTKPLTTEHFAPSRRDINGEIVRYAGWCRPCAAEKARIRRANRTPEQIEADRAYHHAVYEMRHQNPETHARWREARRRWVKANPEKHREGFKRWYDAMMADPERHAAYLENIRITRRLREERRGRTVTGRQSTAAKAWQPTAERMPLEPFSLWIKEVVATDQRDIEELCKVMGVPGRRFRGYLTLEGDHVARPCAERAVWRYGRPVRISPRRVEAELARLEGYWRDAPGNGARLGGYLHDAELLAPLAGAVIVIADDLWVTP